MPFFPVKFYFPPKRSEAACNSFLFFSRIYQPLLLSQVPQQNSQPKCKPCKLFPLALAPLTAHVCCLGELIALAVFPAKQVAILVSFWLRLCACASRLDRDDSVSSPPGAWPCSLCTVFGLTLVFWANFWLCVLLRMCVCVCVCETERDSAGSDVEPES